jgi:hypothetical protein
MKKIISLSIAVLLMGFVAYAGPIFTAGGATSTLVALPVTSGYPVITHLTFSATGTTDDVIVYEWDNTSTQMAGNKSATDTTIVVDDETGIDVNDYVVLINPYENGPYEMNQVSSIDTATNTLTVSALSADFRTDTYVYELTTLVTLADVGTDNVNLSGKLFSGKKHGPMGVRIEAGGIHALTGEAQ